MKLCVFASYPPREDLRPGDWLCGMCDAANAPRYPGCGCGTPRAAAPATAIMCIPWPRNPEPDAWAYGCLVDRPDGYVAAAGDADLDGNIHNGTSYTAEDRGDLLELLGRAAPDYAYYTARRAGASHLRAKLAAIDVALEVSLLDQERHANLKLSLEASLRWERRLAAESATATAAARGFQNYFANVPKKPALPPAAAPQPPETAAAQPNWACAACTFVNENPDFRCCEICRSPRPAA